MTPEKKPGRSPAVVLLTVRIVGRAVGKIRHAVVVAVTRVATAVVGEALAMPPRLHECPAPFALDPVARMPVLPVALALVVTFHPHILAIAMRVVAGRPDETGARRRYDFHARIRRSDIHIDRRRGDDRDRAESGRDDRAHH